MYVPVNSCNDRGRTEGIIFDRLNEQVEDYIYYSQLLQVVSIDE